MEVHPPWMLFCNIVFVSHPGHSGQRRTSQILQTFRRFIVLVALMFWQGGFMFYGGVVVPVGSQVLGSDTQQGFITQAVTNALNLAGLVCLVIWGVNLYWERRDVSRFETAAWGTTFVLLAALVLIHLGMDEVLDVKSTSVTNHTRFGMFHKLYIGISSIQWLLSLSLLFATLLRWSRERETSIGDHPTTRDGSR